VVGFAFTHLLGYRLLPRLKNIGAARLYRPAERATYPGLEPVLTRAINWELITQQYDQMIEYARALQLGTAKAEQILRRFTGKGPKHQYAAGVPCQSTAVFYVPPAARPLLRAARTFLLTRNPDDPRQRLFAGFSPMHEHIVRAAARCGLALPAQPPELIASWPMRVRWTRPDMPLHTESPHQLPAPGQSCLTATAPAAYRRSRRHRTAATGWSTLESAGVTPVAALAS
jgi:hypothetical protein